MDELDAPLCDQCESLERMEPSGTVQRPYWKCPSCGAVKLS